MDKALIKKEIKDYLKFIHFFNVLIENYPLFQDHSYNFKDVDNKDDDSLYILKEQLENVVKSSDGILGLKKGIYDIINSIKDYHRDNDLEFGANFGGVKYSWILENTNIFSKINIPLPGSTPLYAKVTFRYEKENTKLFLSTIESELYSSSQFSFKLADYYFKKRQHLSIEYENKKLFSELIINYSIYSILLFHNFVEATISGIIYNYILNIKAKVVACKDCFVINTLTNFLEDKNWDIKKAFLKIINTLGLRNNLDFDKIYSDYNSSKHFRNSLVHYNEVHIEKNLIDKINVRLPYDLYFKEAEKAKNNCIRIVTDFWKLIYPETDLDYIFNETSESKIEQTFIESLKINNNS
jgi:hypothetical protein